MTDGDVTGGDMMDADVTGGDVTDGHLTDQDWGMVAEPAPNPAVPHPADLQLVVRLDTYEGPLDLLLEQARSQKVDLTQISILHLAEQYLAFVEQAKAQRLELAADYLVMAAWLAYLKSRLLLPVEDSDDEEPTGEALAAALRFQLQRLEAMRRAADRLFDGPLLGRDRFARGAPEALDPIAVPVYGDTLFDLLKAYAGHKRREVGHSALQIQANRLYSVEQAMRRLSGMIGHLPVWTDLASMLPTGFARDPLGRRSSLASMLVAGLELAKSGRVELRQDGTFAPVYLRSRPGAEAGTDPDTAGEGDGYD